mmetsp:Transcript_11708/g.28845  ORF Transcript_11708/g.28845 Transcript_11708/m.28845 type:complete len:110 (+) Transcript_11708:201-530(+)
MFTAWATGLQGSPDGLALSCFVKLSFFPNSKQHILQHPVCETQDIFLLKENCTEQQQHCLRCRKCLSQQLTKIANTRDPNITNATTILANPALSSLSGGNRLVGESNFP